MFVIRSYQAEDFDTVLKMHEDTVRTINAKDYSPRQIEAWATKDELDIASWRQALSSSYSVVAESQGHLVGFANLFMNQGYIDRLYVHKDYQRQGIARAMYNTLESKAIESNIALLTVEAAITSRPFFEKMGFQCVLEQQQKVKDIFLESFILTKDLTALAEKTSQS